MYGSLYYNMRLLRYSDCMYLNRGASNPMSLNGPYLMSSVTWSGTIALAIHYKHLEWLLFCIAKFPE
jgi:hypothetical protein